MNPFRLIISCAATLMMACNSNQQNEIVNHIPQPNNIENESCCFGSTTQIVWKDSVDAELLLKKILDDLNIAYQDLNTQVWDSTEGTLDGIRDYKLTDICNNPENYHSVFLHLNTQLGEAIATKISERTTKPVIMFLEYDQDAWGYCLYESGKKIDSFWNYPEAVSVDGKICKGNAELIANKFSVDKQIIAPYLIQLDGTETERRIFPNDEFDITDHWVRIDFMQKLGIEWPVEGKWIYVIEPEVNGL